MTTPFLNLKTGSLPTGSLPTGMLGEDEPVFILSEFHIQDKVESMLYRTSNPLTKEQKDRSKTIVNNIPNFWILLRDFNAEYRDGNIRKYVNVYYPFMEMNEYPYNTKVAEVKDAERSKGSLSEDDINELTSYRW